MTEKQNFQDMSIVRDEISEFRIDYDNVLDKLLVDLSFKKSLSRCDVDLRTKLEYGSLLFVLFQKNTGAISLSSLIVSDNNYEVSFRKARDEFLSIIEYALPMFFQGNPLFNNFILRVISTDGNVGELPRVFIYDVIFSSDKNSLNKLAVDILVVLMALGTFSNIFDDLQEGLSHDVRSKYPNFSKMVDDFVVSKSKDVKAGYKDIGLLVYKEYYSV
jgi:hypothetical protein